MRVSKPQYVDKIRVHQKPQKILIAVFAAVLLGGGAYAFVTLSIDSASPHTTEPE